MARLLMKNASHIVTCDPSDTVYTSLFVGSVRCV